MSADAGGSEQPPAAAAATAAVAAPPPHAEPPVRYERNQIVWAKLASFKWWPAYIAEAWNPATAKWKVAFGVVEFTSAEQFAELEGLKQSSVPSTAKKRRRRVIPEPDATGATSGASVTDAPACATSTPLDSPPTAARVIDSSRSAEGGGVGTVDEIALDGAAAAASRSEEGASIMAVMPARLRKAVAAAIYELEVWRTVDDHERHCVCRSLDDGRYMIGCDGCSFCWYHPECLEIDVTEEMRHDPSLIPKFRCTIECATCQRLELERLQRLQDRLQQHRRRRKQEGKAAKESKKQRKGGGNEVAHTRRKHSKLGSDPDETETDEDFA